MRYALTGLSRAMGLVLCRPTPDVRPVAAENAELSLLRRRSIGTKRLHPPHGTARYGLQPTCGVSISARGPRTWR